MKNLKTHWYLVAHRAGARVFEQSGITPHLAVVHQFDNLQGRLRDSELTSDRQGRSDQIGSPGHTAVGGDYSPKDGVLKTFVHEIVLFLETKAEQKVFDSLVLVAEPSLLGELKGALRHTTTSRLRDSIIKDLVHTSDHDMEGVLKAHLCMHDEVHA